MFGFIDKKHINQNASPPRTREYWDKIYESKKEKNNREVSRGRERENTHITLINHTHTKFMHNNINGLIGGRKGVRKRVKKQRFVYNLKKKLFFFSNKTFVTFCLFFFFLSIGRISCVESIFLNIYT